MENQKSRLESMETRTAHLLFPSDKACVQILEILVKFPRQTQELMLAVITANRDRGYPRVGLPSVDENSFHTVQMPEPLVSRLHAAKQAEWRKQENSLGWFVKDCCRMGKKLFVRTSALRGAYEAWCKRNGERYPLNREVFAERLAAEYPLSRARRIDGKQALTFEGLALKSKQKGAV